MLIGCSGSSPNLRASGDLGRARAGITIERQPDECGKTVPHIRLKVGDELRTVLKRERGQLDVANARIAECYRFNEDIRAGLAASAS